MSNPTHTLKGVNDEADTCSACGRTNLRRVAWLVALDADGNEDGEAVAYGTDCAGRILYGAKNAKNTALVQDRGARLDRVRAFLAAGHAPEKVARWWESQTCREARVEGAAVRVFVTDWDSVLVAA